MEVVLIKYKYRYEDCEETIGIAINMEVANKYVEDLKTKYPYAYGENYGTYFFDTHKVIEELK